MPNHDGTGPAKGCCNQGEQKEKGGCCENQHRNHGENGKCCNGGGQHRHHGEGHAHGEGCCKKSKEE